MALLTELQDLDFETNALTETIPTELGRLKQVFYVYTTMLTGNVPTEWGVSSVYWDYAIGDR